jgi:micrococcal nuclease
VTAGDVRGTSTKCRTREHRLCADVQQGAPCTMRIWVCLSRGVLTVLALLVVAASAANAQPPAIYLGYVTRVVDGDTIYVAIGSQIESVRYIGVDAPEVEHSTRHEAPGGVAAREVNRALVDGRWVSLVLDVQPRDRFGRLLAYVWANDRFVNGELVWRGYAEAATNPPNVRYAQYFKSLESEARAQARGLWFGVDTSHGEVTLPGAKTAESASGALSHVQSFPLPGDAPSAKYSFQSGLTQSAPTSTQNVQPSARSDGAGMGVGGSYRPPPRR